MEVFLLEMASYAGALLAGIIISIIGFVLSKTKEGVSALSRRDMNRNLRITNILREIRGIVDADRVLLYQFHNGDYFASGSSSQKISLTHYVVRNGIEIPENISEFHQNVPVSFMVGSMEAFMKNSQIFSQVKSLSDDFYFKKHLIKDGTKQVFCLAIKGRGQSLLGVLQICWVSNVVDPISESDISTISDQTTLLLHEVN